MKFQKKKMILFFFSLIMSFFISFCFADDVVLIKITKDGKEEFSVDDRVKEISFFKDYTEQIIGLEKLQNLKKITFDKTAFIKNFNFIAMHRGIEILVIADCTISDFEFITKLEKLKILVLDSCVANFDRLDLINNQKLEFIGITNSKLEHFPRMKNIPQSLLYLNLSFNRISSLSIDNGSELANLSAIIIDGNPIDKVLSRFSNSVEILPEKYLQHIM
ncbi:hypothetical protein ACFL9T_03990 [Thermodesulfobacteriota bacterium]